MSLGNTLLRVAKNPLIGRPLRWAMNRFREGSVTRIKSGPAAGLLWERHHRYVNGYWAGTYESPMQQTLARELAPGQTFFDLGSQAGFFSLLAGRLVSPGGKVVAVEPMPDNVATIRTQFRLNEFSHCHCEQAALGAEAGTASFSFSSTADSQAHLGAAAPGQQSIQVDVITLDQLVDRHGVPHMFKMDIEGFEESVLPAVADILTDHHPKMVVELHGHIQGTPLVDFFRTMDYRIFDLDDVELTVGGPIPNHVLVKL